MIQPATARCVASMPGESHRTCQPHNATNGVRLRPIRRIPRHAHGVALVAEVPDIVRADRQRCPATKRRIGGYTGVTAVRSSRGFVSLSRRRGGESGIGIEADAEARAYERPAEQQSRQALPLCFLEADLASVALQTAPAPTPNATPTS
jgi:hypothetical protein